MKRNYNGWAIYDAGPPTSRTVDARFCAIRFGVSMRANTEEALIAMIDAKCDKFTPGGCHKECCREKEV